MSTMDADETADHLLARLEGLQRRIGRELHDHFDAPIPGLRGSFGRTLGVLPADGARPSDLAVGTAITKQAMGERLREMERLGWITIEPDPADRRARVVRRTPAGDRVRAQTEAGIAHLEAHLAREVGAARYRTFLDVLGELADAVDVAPRSG